MDAVVTGGCGFIGSYLVEFLLEEGFNVRIVDNLSRASSEVFDYFSKMDNVEIKVIDVRDEKMLSEALSGDMIFHLAALTDVEEGEVERSSYWSVNVQGTINILKIASEKNLKVIYASSAAVYGDLNELARENMVPSPLNYYGYTKLEAEKHCLKYSSIIDVVILRLFNVYGERARSGVIKNFLESVRSRMPLTINGDGENVRDFVYVGDVVEAFYKASIQEKASGKIINIGSGKPVKIKDLAEYINERTNVGIRYREQRKNDIRYSVADISQAEKILSWKPRTDLYKWIDEKLKSIIG